MFFEKNVMESMNVRSLWIFCHRKFYLILIYRGLISNIFFDIFLKKALFVAYFLQNEKRIFKKMSQNLGQKSFILPVMSVFFVLKVMFNGCYFTMNVKSVIWMVKMVKKENKSLILLRGNRLKLATIYLTAPPRLFRFFT